ncbi:MAG: acetylglutamate kinase [Planctomycetota bacterium]
MRLVVKVGGAGLRGAASRAEFATAVARAGEAGHQLVLVHGGGPQIRAMAERLGVPQRDADGLRITDDATVEVVTAVLGGTVNKALVLALHGAGVAAVGLCGADGGTVQVRRHQPDGRDLGHVGEVSEVRPQLLELLLGAGYVPVLAPLAPLLPGAAGDPSQLHNVNADAAAAPIARALNADALLFLTDVPALRGPGGERLARIDPAGAARLRADGVLGGGMVPKTDAALAAARAGLHVKIAPAAGDDAVCRALRNDVGTRCEGATRG